MLLRVLNTLNAYPEMKVEIRGFTDNVGKPQFKSKTFSEKSKFS